MSERYAIKTIRDLSLEECRDILEQLLAHLDLGIIESERGCGFAPTFTLASGAEVREVRRAWSEECERMSARMAPNKSKPTPRPEPTR